MEGYFSTGEGQPVLLLHSSMSDKHQWRMLALKLGGCYKVIGIDLAGYGDNALPENTGSFGTDDEIHIIENAMNRTLSGREQFHLVGHSYGGALALKLAHQYKKRISSLTVFEPVAFHLLPDKSDAAAEIQKIVALLHRAKEKNNMRLATKIFIDYWSGTNTFENLSEKNQDKFKACANKVILDFQALFNEELSVDNYAGITCPVCLIKGRQSPAPSLDISKILSTVMPYIETHTIDGGHMAPISNFNTVNKIISDFIFRHDPE